MLLLFIAYPNFLVGILTFVKFIYDNDTLYEVIREWNEAFSLDGNICDNPNKTKQMIL